MHSLVDEAGAALRRPAIVAGAVLFSFVFGCADSSGDADASVLRVPVAIQAGTGPIMFEAEVADSPDERARGLMHRTQLAEREGMLFLFPSERQLSFWMKNTLIPLDMIFIRADRTILGIVENAEPMTETSRFVEGNSQFVLEIGGGLSRKLGITSGQGVFFEVALPSR